LFDLGGGLGGTLYDDHDGFVLRVTLRFIAKKANVYQERNAKIVKRSYLQMIKAVAENVRFFVGLVGPNKGPQEESCNECRQDPA
jgi:hypothetical protein